MVANKLLNLIVLCG